MPFGDGGGAGTGDHGEGMRAERGRHLWGVNAGTVASVQMLGPGWLGYHTQPKDWDGRDSRQNKRMRVRVGSRGSIHSRPRRLEFASRGEHGARRKEFATTLTQSTGVRDEEKVSKRTGMGRTGDMLHAKSLKSVQDEAVTAEIAQRKLDQSTLEAAEKDAYVVTAEVTRDADQARARNEYLCVGTGRKEGHDGPSMPLVPARHDIQALGSTVNSLAEATRNWTQREVLPPPGKACKISPTWDSRWSSTQFARIKEFDDGGKTQVGQPPPNLKQISPRQIHHQLNGGDKYHAKQRRSRRRPRVKQVGVSDANVYTLGVESPPPSNMTRISEHYAEEVDFLNDRIETLEAQLKSCDQALSSSKAMPALPPPSSHRMRSASTRGSYISAGLQSRGVLSTSSRGGARSVPLSRGSRGIHSRHSELSLWGQGKPELV